MGLAGTSGTRTADGATVDSFTLGGAPENGVVTVSTTLGTVTNPDIDPELDGGITGTMKLAQFCDAIGMEVQLHTAGPAHRQCMAAITNTHFYELGIIGPGDAWNGLQPPIYADDYGDRIQDVDADGCVPVPDGPGLGVTYDWDKINAWETAREVYQ